MNYEMKENTPVIQAVDAVIDNPSAAMDLLATVHYEVGCNQMILHKGCLSEDFFRLSTGLAGEILQKFANYRMRLVIVGDFSGYTSKPLQDFIRESNHGRMIGFCQSDEEALVWLSRR